jgi:hypothetical protein
MNASAFVFILLALILVIAVADSLRTEALDIHYYSLSKEARAQIDAAGRGRYNRAAASQQIEVKEIEKQVAEDLINSPEPP